MKFGPRVSVPDFTQGGKEMNGIAQKAEVGYEYLPAVLGALVKVGLAHKSIYRVFYRDFGNIRS
jgi:hypothetical protein